MTKKDLEDVPQQIKDELQFTFVENIDEALKGTLQTKVRKHRKQQELAQQKSI